jgi:hypothetical protein
MPQECPRSCLRSLNPLNLKPGLEYAELLLRFSTVPYAVYRVMRGGRCTMTCTVVTGCIRRGLDATVFDGILSVVGVEARRLSECASNALKNNVKPNCGVPEVDGAILDALRSRSSGAVERVGCLISSTFIDRLLREASGKYTVIKNIDPCGHGSIILLSGQGIHDLPQSKLSIVKLLSQLIPEYIQVEEGWSDYARLAYLIAKAPKELLPHIASLAGRALNVNGYPVDRLEAYITTEALLSRELGFIALIDFEGDMPFVVKFPKSPFKPDED